MRGMAHVVAVALLAASNMACAAACPPGSVVAEHPLFGESPAGCSALDSYYRELRKPRPDWQTVHRCAVRTGDDAVLMMLHANGHGVPRNLDRAIVHACRFDGSTLRVEQLRKMKAGTDRKPFDLCDHVTSGMMTGLCAGIAEEGDSVKRNEALDRLAGTFTPAQRKLLAALRKANDTFAEEVSSNETDLSGTGHAALSIEAQAAVQEELLAYLRTTEGGKFPSATGAAFAAADKALNDVYRKVMARPVPDSGFASSNVTR